MRLNRLFAAIGLLLALASPAVAQSGCGGQAGAGKFCGNNTGATGLPGFVAIPAGSLAPIAARTVLGNPTNALAAPVATGLAIGNLGIVAGTSNGLLYNNAGLLGNLATANNGVLKTDGAGAPSISSTLPSALSIPNPTITGSFTATGLVKNADLVNASTTVGGAVCTLGGSCSPPSTFVVGTSVIVSGTPNGLLYDNGGVLGNLATLNNGVLVTSGSGVPSISNVITLPAESNGGAYKALNNVGTAKTLLTLSDTGLATNMTRLRSAGGGVTVEKSDASAIASFRESGLITFGPGTPDTGISVTSTGNLLNIFDGFLGGPYTTSLSPSVFIYRNESISGPLNGYSAALNVGVTGVGIVGGYQTQAITATAAKDAASHGGDVAAILGGAVHYGSNGSAFGGFFSCDNAGPAWCLAIETQTTNGSGIDYPYQPTPGFSPIAVGIDVSYGGTFNGSATALGSAGILIRANPGQLDVGIGFMNGNPIKTADIQTDTNALKIIYAHSGSHVDGADFSGATFSGCPFKSSGFCVTGSGQIQTNSNVVLQDGFTQGVISATSSFLTHSTVVGTLNATPLGFIVNNALAGSISTAGVWNIGLTGTLTGQMGFSGAIGGTATITVQPAAGTYNLNLPITAGSAGQALTSQGGGSSAMTWVTYLTGNQTITLSGDVTGSGTTAITTTLATVNSNVGTFGSATQSAQITLDGKGRATAAANVTITPAIGNVTGLGTGVATALGVNIGSAGAFVTFNGALGTPSSGVATNLTGTASGLTAGNVTNNANLTGPIASVGNATSITSQTGTGTTFAMSAGPTFTGTLTGSVGSFSSTLASTAHTITSASATALTVGLNGATNPAFAVDASTASQAAGLKVTGAATGGTVAITAIDSGSNTNLTLNAKGTGTIGIGSVSTGAVTITPALTLSAALTYGGVTLSNSVSGTGSMALTAGTIFTGTTTVATLAVTTINAHALGGTISGGGNQINNVVIGASTPLAITGTAVAANTSLTTPHLIGSGSAPTSGTCTGLGSGGTCALVAGSTDSNGRILLTAGTGPSANGAVTLTFASTYGTNIGICQFSAANNTGAWAATPLFYTTAQSQTAVTFQWANGGATALTNASAYVINYLCLAN